MKLFSLCAFIISSLACYADHADLHLSEEKCYVDPQQIAFHGSDILVLVGQQRAPGLKEEW